MTQSFAHLDPTTLAQWLSEGRSFKLVDIRDPMSFAQGHIPGSYHLDNTTVAELVDKTPGDTPVVVVCYHGHSSQQAASWLAGQGFDEVYSLDGGFVDWAHRRPDHVER
ncbi:thiosulfate sulfurtransferase GlpE [Salinicola acroporae]|uniref:Thiosulfate sulfurtransferase GlpE n=1 Tax=Salinicola acroporae TaxID=1541440 RepID=A0ABT6I363_9GAMM|nr:thiosulfate sulfurtransferase GlpE [Salinicola acroporae]MDH4572119.1 thiosulfate sulfurtransferase GlpE [Salinicola acroporae]